MASRLLAGASLIAGLAPLLGATDAGWVTILAVWVHATVAWKPTRRRSDPLDGYRLGGAR